MDTFPYTMAQVLALAVAGSEELAALPQPEAAKKVGLQEVAAALTADAISLAWLEEARREEVAFRKGELTPLVPRDGSFPQASRIRSAVMETVFAFSKTPKEGYKKMAGGVGFHATENDFLSGFAQSGIDDGRIDTRAVEVLRNISSEYSLDDREFHQSQEAAAFQQEWAHGENPLQPYHAQLAELGVFADTPSEAAQLLKGAGDPDPILRKQIEGLEEGIGTEPMREYKNFRTKGVETPDFDARASLKPVSVKEHLLRGATLCLGDWASLKVPHTLKAEAFDRLVALWQWKLKAGTHTKIVANGDDLAGKAALTAARKLGIRTVNFSLSKEGADVRFYAAQPSEGAMEYAVNEVAVALAAATSNLLTLGESPLIGRVAAVMDAWAKFVPSDYDKGNAERRKMSLEDYRAMREGKARDAGNHQKAVATALDDWFQYNGLDIQK